MSLEETLQANTVALKALTAAMGSRGTKQGTAKPAAKQDASGTPTGTTKTPTATVKAVSDLVLSLVDLGHRTVVVKLLKQAGASKVKDVAKAKLPALQKKLMTALKAAKVAKIAADAEAVEAEDAEVDLNFDEEIPEDVIGDEINDDNDLDFLDD